MVRAATKFDAWLHLYVRIKMYGKRSDFVWPGTKESSGIHVWWTHKLEQAKGCLVVPTIPLDETHMQVIHGDSMFILWVGAKTLWQAGWIVCLLPYLMVIFEDKSYIRWCLEQRRMFCEFNGFFGGEHTMLPWATSYVFVLFWLLGLLVLSGENIFVGRCREQRPICCRKRVNRRDLNLWWRD